MISITDDVVNCKQTHYQFDQAIVELSFLKNNNMEYVSNCFEKLKPQTEEEAIKQKQLIAYVAIVPFITSVVMVSIGFMSNNDNDCPGSEAPNHGLDQFSWISPFLDFF